MTAISEPTSEVSSTGGLQNYRCIDLVQLTFHSHWMYILLDTRSNRLSHTVWLRQLHYVLQASGGPAACWGDPPQLLLPQVAIHLQPKGMSLATELAEMHK